MHVVGRWRTGPRRAAAKRFGTLSAPRHAGTTPSSRGIRRPKLTGPSQWSVTGPSSAGGLRGGDHPVSVSSRLRSRIREAASATQAARIGYIRRLLPQRMEADHQVRLECGRSGAGASRRRSNVGA